MSWEPSVGKCVESPSPVLPGAAWSPEDNHWCTLEGYRNIHAENKQMVRGEGCFCISSPFPPRIHWSQLVPCGKQAFTLINTGEET